MAADSALNHEYQQRAGIRIKVMPRILTWIMWSLFFASAGAAYYYYQHEFRVESNGIFRVDGLTMVMWVAATFFSSIVHSYARRYMAGNHHVNQFFATCFAFTLAVLLVTAADHLALFLGGWLLMGLFMARLIGHNRQWGEARQAGRHAMWFFIISTAMLTIGGLMLWTATGNQAISGIVHHLNQASTPLLMTAELFILAAAMIQSALFPFQSWLMSSMTAPTPASGLMHAGFVNAGGILLTRFAPLFYQTDLLGFIVLIGGIGALFGKFWKFVQPNIKRKLGSSTVSQMGFMILQCGLGFFSAAITHLVLHGFYKAYLFLSAGDSVQHTIPSQRDRTLARWFHLPVILLCGLLGGWLFAYLTGKGIHADSGAFLNFVVVLTIIHGTQDIIKRSAYPGWLRLGALPVMILPAILVYALFFNTIHTFMEGLPMAEAPTPIAWYHYFVAGLYLLAFLAIEFEWLKRSKWLYVALLNASQPHSSTVLTYKQ